MFGYANNQTLTVNDHNSRAADVIVQLDGVVGLVFRCDVTQRQTVHIAVDLDFVLRVGFDLLSVLEPFDLLTWFGECALECGGLCGETRPVFEWGSECDGGFYNDMHG